ncbi:MAG: hypothetical protein HQL77_13865 [Magnetococcales bacterium]|nr:hypothetical protein [Magnetococcales bacterium]MBF0436447.1 hypothetical protein [Magnetococcales bacterium]
MLRILAPFIQQSHSTTPQTDATTLAQDGCWKKPLTPTITDGMGNVYPLPDPPQRQFYQADNAPPAELNGREDLW